MMTDRKKKALNEKLLRACRAGKYDSALKLLEEGADVNAEDNIGYTPLMRACDNGHTDIAEELLARGANINAESPLCQTALKLATSNGDVKTTKFLIEKGADINGNGVWTPLWEACVNKQKDTAWLLLEKGADVNIKDNFGHTAFDYGFGTLQGIMNEELLKACKEGKFEDAQKWIEKGADVNARAEDGSTPLMWAALEGDAKTAKLLIQKGADVKAKDKAGNDAFFYAETNRTILGGLKEGQAKHEPSHLTQTLSSLEEKDNRESDASYTLSEEYARGNDVSFSVSNAALIKNKGR